MGLFREFIRIKNVLQSDKKAKSSHEALSQKFGLLDPVQDSEMKVLSMNTPIKRENVTQKEGFSNNN